MNQPTTAAAQNATGKAAMKYQFDGWSGECPKGPLHFVGRIGADHHQFAVSHIDHAHLPVDDRQAQRHQDQDRAERQPVGEIAAPADPVLVTLDGVNGLLVDRKLLGRDFAFLDLLLKELCGRNAVQFAQLGDGRQSLLGRLVGNIPRHADHERPSRAVRRVRLSVSDSAIFSSVSKNAALRLSPKRRAAAARFSPSDEA